MERSNVIYALPGLEYPTMRNDYWVESEEKIWTRMYNWEEK